MPGSLPLRRPIRMRLYVLLPQAYRHFPEQNSSGAAILRNTLVAFDFW